MSTANTHAPFLRAGHGVALVALAIAAASFRPATSAAQRGGAVRRTATVASLLAYPAFYSGQPVRVIGNLANAGSDTPQLFSNEKSLVLLLRRGAGGGGASAAGGTEAVEITGIYYDLGRIEPSDSRLTQFDLRGLSQRIVHKDWPGIGELPVLLVDTVEEPREGSTPSLRAIALDPERYANENVTIVGRFRGRNLFGDVPDSPGQSQWDFVLQSADAALWVTGVRPKGKGFDLRLDNRIDTGKWLKVTGTVKTDRVKVWVAARTVEIGDAPQEPTTDTRVDLPVEHPAPEVVFSAPTEGETDVERGGPVRIQFSRDMDPASFKGHVRVSYVAETPADPSQPAARVDVGVSYDEPRRVLELKFAAPLDPFRRLRIEFEEGVASKEGVPLKPWTLTFTLGG
ncbi:MAG: Ig-like domain-containing protein [Vicinamibacterales bacterium]